MISFRLVVDAPVSGLYRCGRVGGHGGAIYRRRRSTRVIYRPSGAEFTSFLPQEARGGSGRLGEARGGSGRLEIPGRMNPTNELLIYDDGKFDWRVGALGGFLARPHDRKNLPSIPEHP